jgi:3-hydroxyacyl-[acyl-carrier protein] dehydratase/trans-2-decenoyl-[acyl-carrier protein] isomerase
MAEKFISEEEIKKIASGESSFHKKLFAEGAEINWTCRLPHGPMKMIDRAWYDLEKGQGKYQKGYLRAEKDIHQDDWYFYAHFLGDPVMPGTMGLDGCYQCLGLTLLLLGHRGVARALAGTFEYTGQVLTNVKKTVYRMDIKRIINKPSPLLIADVDYFKDDDKEPIYKLRDARMGFFKEGELERSPSYRPNWEKIKETALKEIEKSRQYYIKHFGKGGY